MKSKDFCSSKLLVVLLVILLTILIVHIALNSFNKEMFSSLDYTIPEGHALFHSSILPADLQCKSRDMIKSNPANADNSYLSSQHLKQVYETRRPELITPNPKSPEELCYISTQG